MRRLYTGLTLILLGGLGSFLFAQGEAAMLFLLIPPSPAINGAGATATAIPTDDAFGFFYNPAQLGLGEQNTNASIHFYPSKVNWLPNPFTPFSLNSIAVSIGYNLKNYDESHLVRWGLGYMKTDLSYGKQIITDEKGEIIKIFEPQDSYQAIAIGVGFDYDVKVSLGFAYKRIHSMLGYNIWDSLLKEVRAKASAIDVGMLAIFPMVRQVREQGEWFPFFDLSLGLALTNIGGTVSLLSPEQKDPLPRTAKLGYGLSAGMDLQYEQVLFRLLQMNWSVEVNDMLVKRKNGELHYQFPLSDVDFWENLILLKGSPQVARYRGWRILIGEVFQFCGGNFTGRGYYDQGTHGVGVRAQGFLKWLKSFNNNNKTIAFIADHFDVRYFNTDYFTNMFKTNFKGISLVISGF